ncbi:hypothetical protein MAP00_002777 [Monascus purpureus]|nr:hypothetical protein MAP00_002777 [Monascus purpureus]
MLNKSDAVSEAQQNLIMKHSSIRTFLDHYLPRNIDTDMQNIMNGRDPNTQLMNAITRMSRWIDNRRPWHLTPIQRASLREHPEYLEATRRVNEQAKASRHNSSIQMQLQLEKLTRERTNTFNRLARALRQQIRKEFDRKQAIIDIERQLSGAAINDEEAKDVLRTDQMLPEQIYLFEKLFTWPTSLSLENEWQRRNAAVKAISQYCSLLEGGPLRGRPKRATLSDGFDEEQSAIVVRPAKIHCASPKPSQQELLLQQAEEHIRIAEQPQRCFQCFGNTMLQFIVERRNGANTSQH